MKEIKAIIQPFRINAVMDALRGHPELPGITVSHVVGFGQQRAAGILKTQREYVGSHVFAKQTKIEAVVDDDVVDDIVDAIVAAAHTGNPGDGVVFVYDVCEKRRIRDAEHSGSS